MTAVSAMMTLPMITQPAHLDAMVCMEADWSLIVLIYVAAHRLWMSAACAAALELRMDLTAMECVLQAKTALVSAEAMPKRFAGCAMDPLLSLVLTAKATAWRSLIARMYAVVMRRLINAESAVATVRTMDTIVLMSVF